jgi:Bardet-Biedl syndrome 7 protein
MPRLVVSCRIREGQTGRILAYVVSRGSLQTSSVVSYPVLTLCLHYPIHKPDAQRAFGHLELSGDFTVADMHAWLLEILPGAPQQPTAGEGRLTYEHAGLCTQLHVLFRDGAARFSCDSAPTLALLRTALNWCAHPVATHRPCPVAPLARPATSCFAALFFATCYYARASRTSG